MSGHSQEGGTNDEKTQQHVYDTNVGEAAETVRHEVANDAIMVTAVDGSLTKTATMDDAAVKTVTKLAAPASEQRFSSV